MDSGKTRLRKLWRARLLETSAVLDDALILALETWALPRYEVVLGTLPLRGEPDLTAFYRRWLDGGRRLGLARTNGPKLDFALVSDLGGPWNTRMGGLKEPPASATAWHPGPATLVLVPGLAFATLPEGVLRLGRGGGYFDRWLAVYGSDVTALAVGFPFQLTDSLPRERHDVLLDGYLGPGFHGLEPQ